MYNVLKHPGEYWLGKKNSVPSSSFGNICMSGMLFIHEHIPFLIKIRSHGVHSYKPLESRDKLLYNACSLHDIP